MVATSILFKEQKRLKWVIMIQSSTYGATWIYGPYGSQKKASRALRKTEIRKNETAEVLPLRKLEV